MIKNKSPRSWDTLFFAAELLKANADALMADIISVSYSAGEKERVDVHVVDVDALAPLFNEMPIPNDEYNNYGKPGKYFSKCFFINNVKFFSLYERGDAENVESN